jgi:tetratricopeptide (TPR) repeat protein
MISLAQDLEALESANLIRRWKPQPETEYIFRHTLMQETAYVSLLRKQRAELHRVVGDVLERRLSEGQDDLAAVLAHHYQEAGQDAKAIEYYKLAGQRARDHYANQEASEYYARALALAKEIGNRHDLPALHRAGGQIYEILGDFERARNEHKASLTLARELDDLGGQWQACIDLGMLWASRDYERTQDYYQRALDVARRMGDQTILAHTLNRIGNLEVNISLPLVSEARHQEALEIFQKLGDETGIAETLDYLAMTCLLSARNVQGHKYGQEAARLFLSQGDELRLASTLATSGMRGANLESMHISNTEENSQVILQDAIQALRLADNIGWRSGSAFAQISMASVFGVAGEFGKAVSAAQDAVRIAEEIGHEQWALAGKAMLGAVMLEMLNPEDAIGELKDAEQLADRSNSLHWHNTVTGFMAVAWIDLKDYDTARALLESNWPNVSQPRSLSEGKLWFAMSELDAAQGDYESALKLVQSLVESSPDTKAGNPVPRLGLIQGRCFSRLGIDTQAQAILRQSLSVCEEQGSSSITWRLHRELAEVQRRLGNADAAAQSMQAAERLVDSLAESIHNPKHRHVFRRRAARRLTTSSR